MVLFSFKTTTLCIIKVIFFINILTSLVNEIEPTLPLTSLPRGRTQSISAVARESVIKPVIRTQPETISSSLSSFSSSNSINSANNVKTKPAASTSNFKEVDLERPLVEKTKRVSFITDVNLREASEQTHSDHLNPSRDGVRARVHRILLKYGAPIAVGAAVGGAIGVGAFEFLNTSTTTTTTTQKSVDSSQHVNFDSN